MEFSVYDMLYFIFEIGYVRNIVFITENFEASEYTTMSSKDYFKKV